jgi:phosphate-selective porin
MKKILFVLISFVLFSANINAQGCSDSGGDDGIKVIGFIQPQYEYQFLGDSVQSIMNGLKTPSSFYFNRARLGVTGNIPYDFAYYFVGEFSPNKGGNPYVLDAFVTYNRWAPYLKISMGQFKMPFGLELSTGCQDLYTVDRSRVVNELASPFRDFGVMALGTSGEKQLFGMTHKDIFKYYVALTNGSGMNMMDNNTDKDITARLIFSPMEGLNFGGSYRYGRQAAISTTMIDDSRMRWGADMSLKKWNLIFQGEYIHGVDKGSSLVGGGCGSVPTIMMGNFVKSGYWAAVQYETKWMLNPIVKYQSFLSTTDILNVDDLTMTEILVGFNYYFNEWTRFQANYVITKDSSIPATSDYAKNYLVLQAQVKFN